MLAAFQVGRGDSSIDSFAECRNVPNITVLAYQVCFWVELSTGLFPVAVLAAAVLDTVFLTATTTVHRATGAGAPSAILKRSRQKVADWLKPTY
jgi:hypothetical protein